MIILQLKHDLRGQRESTRAQRTTIEHHRSERRLKHLEHRFYSEIHQFCVSQDYRSNFACEIKRHITEPVPGCPAPLPDHRFRFLG